MASPSEYLTAGTAARVLHAIAARPATLGAGRLLCIDGLAGAGKTTLAAQVADLSPGTPVIHTDDLLEGWGGLSGLPASLERLLRPLARGEAGHWRRWDWFDSAWAEEIELAPSPLLIIEGVGSAAACIDDLITMSVWIEAERSTRLQRGLARDGASMTPQWLQWLQDEAAHHEAQDTRARADLLLLSDPPPAPA